MCSLIRWYEPGAIYYNFSKGEAFAVYGVCYRKWKVLRLDGGILGDPRSDTGTRDGGGQQTTFLSSYQVATSPITCKDFHAQ